jgi:hypothetical protein
MKSLKDIRTQIDEVLTKKDPAAKWIHDFVHSDNPQFAGKSMAKRRQMALAAYYSKKNEAAFVSPSMSTDIKGDLEEAFLTKKEEDDLDNLSSDDFVKKYGRSKHSHRKSHATRASDVEKFTESQEEDDRQAAEHNQKELEQQQQELEAKKKKQKVKEEVELEEGKKGLWANIHAKRKRIAAGSGERMRKPGSKGAPSDQDLKNSQEQVEEVQIDEISKNTLASYIKKAHKDNAMTANDLGHQLASSKRPGLSAGTDPTYTKGKTKYLKRSAGIDTAVSKLAKEAVEYKGIGTDVVDKKKVLNPPIPLTQKKKTVKDFKEQLEIEESRGHKIIATFLKNREVAQRAFTGQNKPVEKKPEPEKKEVKEGEVYDEKWKKFKKIKEGVTMLNFNDFLKEGKYGSMKKEELKGNQHKLDKNKNGKLDADDFEKLRNEAKKCMDEDDMDESGLRMAAHSAHKAGKKEFEFKGKTYPVKVQKEEVEPIDEISKDTLASYIPKAAKSSRIHGMISKDYANSAERKRNPGLKSALDRLSKKYKSKAWKREDGIATAVKKLTKEDVQIDEGKMKDIHTSMMHHADKKGYSSHKQFTPADYDAVGKEHGISGKELAVIAGHKTAQQVANEAVDKVEKDASGKVKSWSHEGDWKKTSSNKEGSGKAANLAGQALKKTQQLSKEEVEQIEELDKKTLGSYVKKASADITKREVRIDRAMDASGSNYNEPSMQKALNKNVKRVAGLNKAADKLAKEEVEHVSEDNHAMSYVNATLAVMDEGKLDDLRDAQKLRAANKSAYDKDYKADTSHPHITTHKGTSYGGQAQKDDEGDEKKDDEKQEKRGRGRPSGSKSGARQKGNGREDGGIPVHSLHLPNRNK